MFPDIVTFATFKKRSNDYIKCLYINKVSTKFYMFIFISFTISFSYF